MDNQSNLESKENSNIKCQVKVVKNKKSNHKDEVVKRRMVITPFRSKLVERAKL